MPRLRRLSATHTDDTLALAVYILIGRTVYNNKTVSLWEPAKAPIHSGYRVGEQTTRTAVRLRRIQRRPSGSARGRREDVSGAGSYLNAPALSAAVLRTDVVEGTTLYRTGDLAYRDDRGNYVYVGRSDRVIKRHGVRMSLVEVCR